MKRPRSHRRPPSFPPQNHFQLIPVLYPDSRDYFGVLGVPNPNSWGYLEFFILIHGVTLGLLVAELQ